VVRAIATAAIVITAGLMIAAYAALAILLPSDPPANHRDG
jgi:phage shock protein PspC (stress-responsive transcriptional regulator)